MYPCLVKTGNDSCKTCPMTGGNTHDFLDALKIVYKRTIICSMKGVYLMLHKTKYLIEVGSTDQSYSNRFNTKFTKKLDVLHQPKDRHNWIVFGLGSSDDEPTDRFLECVFHVLINQQQTHTRCVYSMPIWESTFRPRILQLIQKNNEYGNLFSTKIFFNFIFEYNSK